MDTGYPPPNSRHVGRAPRARNPIALAPSITAWRLAHRELAKHLQSSAEPWQRGCPPIPVCSRSGDPTMPPHHVKVPGPRGWRGWRGLFEPPKGGWVGESGNGGLVTGQSKDASLNSSDDSREFFSKKFPYDT